MIVCYDTMASNYVLARLVTYLCSSTTCKEQLLCVSSMTLHYGSCHSTASFQALAAVQRAAAQQTQLLRETKRYLQRECSLQPVVVAVRMPCWILLLLLLLLLALYYDTAPPT
jgi:hypothetical protein